VSYANTIPLEDAAPLNYPLFILNLHPNLDYELD